MNHLEIDHSNSILEITLNRPTKANALDLPLIHSLVGTLEKASINPDVKAILLTGKGNFFCAGGDLDEMAEKRGMFAGDPSQIMENYQRGIQQIPRIMESLKMPIVAAINGAAVGAGLDLACMCDIRLASPQARFGETFCRLGLISGDGGAFFLPRIVGYAKAMEMTLTGTIYSAEEALGMGLINQIISSKNLTASARDICQQITAHSSFAIGAAKSALKGQRNLETILEMAAAHQALAHTTEEHRSALQRTRK